MTTSLTTRPSLVRIRYDTDETGAPSEALSRLAGSPASRNQAGIPTALRDGSRPRVLHVGCGHRSPARLHRIFRTPAWRELRLDIDPDVKPDIVASIVDLGNVETGSCDAIWCSHNLEHLCEHEVAKALCEFRRVLAPDGFALIRSPDVGAVAEIILTHGLDHIVYRAPAGPITAVDMLYGHSASIAKGNAYMRHGTGFTSERLGRVLREAGFPLTCTGRTADFTVWAAAFMPKANSQRVLRALQRTGLKLTEAARSVPQ